MGEVGIKVGLRADGGHGSRAASAFPATPGTIPVIRVRINSGARAGGMSRAHPRAVLEQPGGRTSRELGRMTKE